AAARSQTACIEIPDLAPVAMSVRPVSDNARRTASPVSTRACRQLSQPDDAGRQVHGGEEVARGLVVTRRDRAVLLEFGEEVLDQVTRRVDMSIELPLRLTIGL